MGSVGKHFESVGGGIDDRLSDVSSFICSHGKLKSFTADDDSMHEGIVETFQCKIMFLRLEGARHGFKEFLIKFYFLQTCDIFRSLVVILNIFDAVPHWLVPDFHSELGNFFGHRRCNVIKRFLLLGTSKETSGASASSHPEHERYSNVC